MKIENKIILWTLNLQSNGPEDKKHNVLQLIVLKKLKKHLQWNGGLKKNLCLNDNIL